MYYYGKVNWGAHGLSVSPYLRKSVMGGSTVCAYKKLIMLLGNRNKNVLN